MIKTILRIIKRVFKSWAANADAREAASIAFYTIFSLAPTLIIGVFIAGMIIGEGEAKMEIVAQVEALIGEEGGAMVKTVLDNLTSFKQGFFAGSLGLLVLIYGATKVFAEMRYALNKIFKVKTDRPTHKQIMSIVRGRLLGFALIVSLGFFLLVSLFTSALLKGFEDFIASNLTIGVELLDVLNFGISVGLVGIIFAVILKVLPEVKIQWRSIFWGSLVSAVTFTVGKDLIGLYLGSSGVSSAYGAAGSAIILLIWVYFTAQAMLLGAEVAQAVREEG